MASEALLRAVNGYQDHIKRHGLSEEAIDALILASQTAIGVEGDVEYGLKVSKLAKACVDMFVKKRTGGSILDLDSYCNQNHTSFAVLEQWYAALKVEAPFLFDSYLLYLEKNRDERNKFYFPKMRQLNRFGVIQAMQDLEDDKLDRVCLSMPPGTQKCQPLYSKVLTPDGFIEMRDVHIGTQVIAGNGKAATVISTSAVQSRPIYELTFDDGSKVRCSDNHIWHCQTRDDRRRGNKYRDVELRDMLHNLRVENGKRLNYSIDYVCPIEFAERELLLHPYVMGALLGDGGFSSGGTVLTTRDPELIDTFNHFLPNGYVLKHHDRVSYLVHGHEGNNAKAGSLISLALKKYGLWGHRSHEKFIPKDYLYASYEQRLWLLRGLLDTDGSSYPAYACITTVSKQLADDIRELVRSLGGYASCVQKPSAYRKADGTYKQCRDAYTITIQFASGMDEIFALPRKQNVYKPKRSEIKRFLKDVLYIGEEECKCILIDDPCHLYITDDYIITHNTTLEKFFCSWVIGRDPSGYSIFFSHSDDITRMFYKGALDIMTSDEYTFSEIFPDCVLQATDAKAETINFGNYKPFASLQCSSIGSKNAGKIRANKYEFIDDLIGKLEEALNPVFLDKVWSIYAVDLKQRKLNELVKELIIATRWSVRDVIGRVQSLYEGNPRLRTIAIPDIDPETGKSNFDYKYNGMSVAFFEDQALAMDDISYRCLYKQEPIEREGLLYHDEDLMRYLTLPEREPDAVLGICDVKNKGSDDMFLPVCLQYGEKHYFVDCICDDNADFGVQEERCSDILVKWGVQQCRFESNNGGDRFAENVTAAVDAKKGRCNITTKFTESNKETKIIVNADWVKKHVVFPDKSLYAPKSDMGKAMTLLLTYSVTGKNPRDDVPDGFAQYALMVTEDRSYARVEAIRNPFSGWYT